MRHGRLVGFHARSPRVSTRGFLCKCQARRAGLCPSGRRPAKRTAARRRGFACSMLPGFHPGLLACVPGPEGRVVSKRAQARQANRGTTPRARVDHAPGLPPGASWIGDGTDSLFTGRHKHDSQLDPCSGNALLNSSAHHQSILLGQTCSIACYPPARRPAGTRNRSRPSQAAWISRASTAAGTAPCMSRPASARRMPARIASP